MRLGDIIGLIQCSFNFLGINGRMALLLFHTREWWQHEFLVNVMTVIHEVNTGAVREIVLQLSSSIYCRPYFHIYVLQPQEEESLSISRQVGMHYYTSL